MKPEKKLLTIMITIFNYIDYFGQSYRIGNRRILHIKRTIVNDETNMFPLRLHQNTTAHSLLYENSLLLLIHKYKPLKNLNFALHLETNINPQIWNTAVNFYLLSLLSLQFTLSFCSC